MAAAPGTAPGMNPLGEHDCIPFRSVGRVPLHRIIEPASRLCICGYQTECLADHIMQLRIVFDRGRSADIVIWKEGLEERLLGFKRVLHEGRVVPMADL